MSCGFVHRAILDSSICKQFGLTLLKLYKNVLLLLSEKEFLLIVSFLNNSDSLKKTNNVNVMFILIHTLQNYIFNYKHICAYIYIYMRMS